ncbi:hypothetical protein SARC_12344 [Sphaeroforma arctica JP610]|uniref:Uncharacterized protein n=1 Tax=Sphaeroforma arctica JP610 TaxID=667725 RepID=A0A0L0FED7_9EUKA|nr:hypothetical protein SARC_12344 [Sphaeroforma arctica JP610]KNC75124.1 hypothetical protein SARC_12344 [Sphaeroforma arctica JP610]|eukprot:XP_014149026.1 hypothetical protein SARC_12344 [Sphaeroforma arctica JP610]
MHTTLGKLTAPFPWGPETFAKRCGKRRDLHVWYNRLLDEHAPSFRVNIIDVDFCENDLRFVNVIINSNSRFVPRMGVLGDGTVGTASGLMANTNTTTTNGNMTSANGNTTMANENTTSTNVNTATSNGNTTTADASTVHDGNTVSFAGHSSGMGVELMASGISLSTNSNRERSESVGTSHDM